MSNQAQPSPDDDGVDLRNIVRDIFGFKWHMLAVLILVLVGVGLWTARQVPIYQASCSIEYDPNPARPMGDEMAGDPIGAILVTREFIETQNHIITSRTISERVVRELGLQHDAAFLAEDPIRTTTIEGAALVLQSRITVEPVRDTRLVWIRVEDRDPERAALLSNAIADAYIEKTLEDRLGTTVDALEWLSAQLDSLRTELESSELALHDFKRENNVLSVSLEDRQNLVANVMRELNTALTTARTRRIELQARLNQLRVANREHGEAGAHATAIDENPRVVVLRQQLSNKRRELEAGSLRYGAAHPSIRGLTSEVVTVQEQLNEEIDGIIRSAELDAREIREIERGLRSALDDANEAGLALNLREIEYSRLSRQRENNSKIYDTLLSRTTETNLAQRMSLTNVRIVDRALRPGRASKPRVVFNMAAGLVLGFLLALALGLVLSRLDRRVRTVEELEALGLQVLGMVPATVVANETGAEASKARDTLVHDKPLSAFAESMRRLRTNLTFMSLDEPMKCIVVTSAGPGEGKTTVATNLAIAMAQAGKSVLLIDTDLRRPRVHKIFDASSSRGMTTVLLGEASLSEVTTKTHVPNLDVVGCGPTPPNPAELLHTKAFRQVRDEAIQRYDFVVFDSPPLGVVADSAVIAAQVEGVVIVIQSGKTTREAVVGANRQLSDVGTPFIGAVLNAAEQSSQGYGGYYYYGSKDEVEEESSVSSRGRRRAG